MKPKCTLIAVLLLVITGLNLNAQGGHPQGGGSPPDGPPRRQGRGPMAMNIEQLKTELKLSDEQCTKLKPILENIKKIFESARPQGKPGSKPEDGEKRRGSRDEMKKKMKEINKKIQAALESAKKFLSDEQYKALKEKFTPKRGRKGGRRSKKTDDSSSGTTE